MNDKAPKLPSDFNDLQVIVGLDAVRQQITQAMSRFGQGNSPAPLDGEADQFMAPAAENWPDREQPSFHDEIPSPDDFELDFAPDPEAMPEPVPAPVASKGQQLKGDGERPGYTLKDCLKRFRLVEGKNDIYDSRKSAVIKTGAFTRLVGKTTALAWMDHPDRKLIDPKALKNELDIARSEEAKDLIARYIHLEGTLESWDTLNHERVKNVTIKEAHPNYYDIWLKSPVRRMIHHRDLVFDPTESVQPPKINMFTGLEVGERLGPDGNLLPINIARLQCQPFLKLLEHLCDGEPEAYEWLLKWLAYPLQHKGAKMATSVLMHGNIHGAGKSLFFDGVMSRIYTKYHVTLDQRDLESNYNDWAEQRLFLLFEEIANNKTKHGMMGFIKHLITGETLSVHRKFLASMQQANHMNTVFLSNHTQPLPLEEHDRRFLVIYPKKLLPPDLQSWVVKYLQDEAAVDAFYTYLLQVDLGDFGSHTKPPMTQAKRDIITYTKPGYDTFITLWQAGDTEYPHISCTSTQLYQAYCSWSKRTNEHIVSQKRFMGEARKYGVESSAVPMHWRQSSGRKGQAKMIIVGSIPDVIEIRDRAGNVTPKPILQQDYLGDCVAKFDNALHGDQDNVPYARQTA